jgi:CheY-like chemotaxis protein
LRKLKCSYVHAENGRVAVDLLRHTAPGMFTLVLCDLRMPVMDGFEACKTIKAETPSLPVVALSGETGLDTKTLIEVNGFNGFVPKPVKYQQIEDIIATYSAERIAKGFDI